MSLGRLFVERSGECLIDAVVMTLEDDRITSHTAQQFPQNARRLMDLTKSISHRIRGLAVEWKLTACVFFSPAGGTRSFSRLRSLQLKYASGFRIDDALPFNVQFPRLNEVHITGHPWFYSDAFQNNTLPFSSITSLRLSTCSIRAAMMLLVCCNQVETLELADVYEYNAEMRNDVEDVDWEMSGLADGVFHCPSLRSLTIGLHEEIMKMLFQHTQFPGLEYLCITQNSTQFMQRLSAEGWRSTLSNVITISIGDALPTRWSQGLESVRTVELLEGEHTATAADLKAFVGVLPDSVEVLTVGRKVVWIRP